MDYPNNRLIVQGVDLTEKYNMVLEDGYILSPPEPKTYIVDIPGGNGQLDLTESLMGDVVYKNRKDEFSFKIIGTSNFEQVKTQVSNFLHGKSYDYQITMDPDYTRHGRFTVSSYSHQSYANGIVGTINISIDAKPFKYLSERLYRVNGIGGAIVYVPSGRKKVRPVIEVNSYTKIIYDNKLTELPQGTWTINDLILTEGENELYFNTYDIKNLKWNDLTGNSVAWGQFKNNRLFEWYKSNGAGPLLSYTWSNMANNTWSSLSETKWADLVYVDDQTPNVKDTYLKYEWGDL